MIKIEPIEALQLICINLRERCILLESEKNLQSVSLQRVQFVQELATKYGFDPKTEFRLDEQNNTLIPVVKENGI